VPTSDEEIFDRELLRYFELEEDDAAADCPADADAAGAQLVSE
jgi:hypothetical protein